MKIEPESDVQHVLGGVCYLFHVPNYPVFYLKKKNKKTKKKPKGYMHLNIQCSTVYKSQDMEAA